MQNNCSIGERSLSLNPSKLISMLCQTDNSNIWQHLTFSNSDVWCLWISINFKLFSDAHSAFKKIFLNVHSNLIHGVFLEQDKFGLEVYFRSRQCNEENGYSYSTNSWYLQFQTEFPHHEVDYDASARHIRRLVNAFLILTAFANVSKKRVIWEKLLWKM